MPVMHDGGHRTPRVAIVGGGITGLSAAHRLVRLAQEAGRDLQVELFEKAEAWGGKIQSVWHDEMLFEAGPDSFLGSRPAMAELCHEIGLGDELVSPPDGAAAQSFIRQGSTLHPVPQGFRMGVPVQWAPFLRSPLISWRGKLRLAFERFIPPRREGGDETLAQFARRRVGPEVADTLLEPLLARIYSADPQRLSVQATFPWLHGMERRYGSLYAAVRQQQSAAGQRGQQLLTARRGLGSVVERLVDAMPHVRRSLGTEVTEVHRTERGYRLRFTHRQEEHVDGIVLAAPAPETAAMLRDWAPSVADELGSIEYASVASIYVVFPREAISHPLSGTGYLAVSSAQTPVKACTWFTSKWPHADRRGERIIIRVHISGRGRERPTDWDDSTLVGYVFDELASTLGIRERPLMTQVFRWPQAIPQYDVGHVERIERIEEWVEEQPALAMVGAALRGIGLAACARQGREAAERVWAGLQSSLDGD